ncbi:hypothetical protein KQI85_06225 [Falcatimonas sp. MSJ-15]|nr:hypothetical protein [Falcatimonas sp. MSJ-15]MBU5469962.1 hypothetical protein [Falcatimonas sp. MSJ-15]
MLNNIIIWAVAELSQPAIKRIRPATRISAAGFKKSGGNNKQDELY